MGEKIAELRARKRMTQEALAARSGVSRATISGLESGRVRQTTIGTLRKLAGALEVDVACFFTQDA